MMQHDVSDSISVTTGPIAGSTKIYADGVPFRRVNLSNGEHFDLYDTSGPYTDPEAAIDLVFGPAMYRLVAGHAPLDDAAADAIIDAALRGLAHQDHQDHRFTHSQKRWS